MKAIRTVLACIRKADHKYNLIQHGDKIIVGVSGGKDSVLLLYALFLYQKFSHTDFVLQPVIMDLGFDNFNPEPIKEFCEKLGLNLIISDNKEVYKILKIQQKDSPHLPCSICSRMKKAAINKVANDLGFNKVAFAHHVDDAIETFAMNEIYGGRLATFAPKMHLERADIVFIRPLCLLKEKDIIRCVKEENLPVLASHCPADKYTTREEIKSLLKETYKKYPFAEENFINMLSNYEKDDTWGKEIYYQVDQNGLTLKPVITPYDATLMIDIRYKVFIVGQDCPYEEEIVLLEEKEAKAFLIYKNDTPIGTIRYRKLEEGIKLERFAILNEYQKQGYGRKVITFLVEMLAHEYNPVLIYFNAQYHLKDFYSSIGFNPVGETFMEAGIKHIRMEKQF